MQQGMLFHALSDPRAGVDIEQLCCELFEALDVAAFKRAWQRAIARHPVLRTSFRWEDVEEPQQEVHGEVELPWKEQDWRGVTRAEREKRFADFLASDRRRGFDLAQAPLIRLTLLRYDEAENCFVLTFHHAILEGRSFALLFQEVFAFYDAFRRGEDINLPLPRPYRDYIDWLQQQDFSKDEAFWRETLRGFTAPSPLVVDYTPNKTEEHENRSGDESIQLSREFTAALRTVARDNQLTLNTFVQGAWALMLSRYSGESDVLFGVVRAARPPAIEGVQEMIGLFLNTLPLRVRVRPEAELLPWLKEILAQWAAMRNHEHTPLVDVQGWSDVPAGTPLFQSTMRFDQAVPPGLDERRSQPFRQ